MNRRMIIFASLTSLLPQAAETKKKKRKKRKPKRSRNTCIIIKNEAGEQWNAPIKEALVMINKILGKEVYALDNASGHPDITIVLVTPDQMINPGAWGEAPLNGDTITLSTIAIPNPALICHEITHTRGYDHSPDWVNLEPCPFK